MLDRYSETAHFLKQILCQAYVSLPLTSQRWFPAQSQMESSCLGVLVFVFSLVFPLLVSPENRNINGTRGAPVLWQCHHNLSRPFQPEDSRMYWQTQDAALVLHVYNKGKEEFQYQSGTFRNRTEIFPDQLPSGDFSLVIQPLTLEDDQLSFEVVFLSSRREKLCQRTLHVAAPFQQPTIDINDTQMTASCRVKGGFPVPVVTWTSWNVSRAIGRTLEAHEVQTNVTREEDGTYRVHSTVSIAESQSVSCTVYNPTSNQTVSASWTRDIPPNRTELIVGAVVGSILIAVCIAVGIWCNKGRSNNGGNGRYSFSECRRAAP